MLQQTKIIIVLMSMILTFNLNAQKNIVFLFSDDAGYHDFGFQGSKTFKTPNLDKLASEGVIFKQAYTTAEVCGPSRAGLLTGKYQQRFGFEENNVTGYMSESSRDMGAEMGLPLDQKTIADYLKKLGYKSIILGKWHMGNADRYHPLNRGFDEFYGFREGGRSFWAMDLETSMRLPYNRLERGYGVYNEPEKYLTYDLADKACDFMERNQDKPFFMYVAFNAVHAPVEFTKEDLETVKGLGLDENRERLAAMNVALDNACGQILDKLEELGLKENTLVVFSNDNGGPDVTETCNYPLSGCKATLLEGGIRVPFLMRLPNVIEAGSTYKPFISTLDLLPTFVNIAGGNAEKIEDLDGVDLIPYVTGEKTENPHEKLFWKIEQRGVVRQGDWKFMRFPDRPAELYNIAKDVSEKKNLANKYPEKVREMYKTLWAWEAELERPMFMLKRKYEVNAVKLGDEKRDPKLDELNK